MSFFLFQAVELGIERHQPVAVRFDDLLEALVEIDKERVVHRLKRDREQPPGARRDLLILSPAAGQRQADGADRQKLQGAARG